MQGTDAPAVECPFTVVIDSREQLPYSFEGLLADARQKHRPLVVNTEWGGLKQGDYSIKGMEAMVAIERKSLADLYGSCAANRERFEAEHKRLAALDFAAIVIESGWRRAVTKPPKHSKLNPKIIFRTAMSWMVKYRIPWLFMDAKSVKESRRFAEITTFRLLEKFWEQHNDTNT